jgi:hypothetical protein
VTGPVRVTIDVVSVAGFDAAQAAAFGQALERSLARLIETRGLPVTAAASSPGVSISLGAAGIRPDQPERTGEAVAREVYRRLER